MKSIKNILIAVFTAGAFLAAAYFSYIFSGPNTQEEVIFEVSDGASFASVTKTLAEKNIIGDVRLFKIYAASRGDLRKIKPGEYKITKDSTKKSILDAITKGNVILYKITVPEGSNMFQIGDILEAELKIPKNDFVSKSRDKEFLNKMQIEADSAEGYLYPETYYFPRKTSAENVLAKMISTFHEKYTDDITEKGKKLGLSKDEIIVLASMIEKETGLTTEREMISAVFHNRLKRGMRLQSDPTTIYGIFERYRGNLSKKDLLENTPYNTYRIKRLPAGPIANPGLESIRAAVNPAAAQYLYFVSRNDKSHVFANTLIEHNANVSKYQLHK